MPFVATTMLPDPALLASVHATDRITETARPTPEFREQLRRIPNVRNAFALALLYAQTIAIVVVAVHFDDWRVWGDWLVWIAAFVLMGRAHAQFAALMHESAHRLLFRDRKINDFVGRWLLGFPSFTPIDSYRRGHMAHHREEFGPDEPDIPLYRGYPISEASMRRKLVRDATGRTGWKLFKGLLGAVRSDNAPVRFQARAIVASQLGLIAIGVATGHPFVYFVLWLAPYLTVWRVINRLRSIAEHGGMQRSKDRRETTHSVKQSPVARFFLVPFHIGWHLAHHVDAGVPMAHLPRLHAELRRAGYVTEGLEYRNYTELWRRLASGASLAG
jgi:fatty acid desaturase